MGDWFTITISTVSLVFSCISTVVAGIVALYTFVRWPRVDMTRPTFVAFAFDGSEASPKVFTRTLLFSTADPGLVVETMFAQVKQGEKLTTYSFWSYHVDGRLVAGGGLFVATQGIVTDHHFVLGKNTKKPVFETGAVTVDICARVVGERKERHLQQLVLTLTEDQAAALNRANAGVFFERSPESDEFHGEVKAALAVARRAEAGAAPDSAT